MTLEKHIIDTMKEWQLKIGSLDTGIGLYYPKDSLCGYLGLDEDMENEQLEQEVENYLNTKAPYLGKADVSYAKDRYCIRVDEVGCDYITNQVEEPEFLKLLLEQLKKQDFEGLKQAFEQYAKDHKTTLASEQEEDGLGTVFYFADEEVEPYVYCVEQDGFGITYHRFAKSDYVKLTQ